MISLNRIMLLKKTVDNQTEFAGEAPILTAPNLAEIDPAIAQKELQRKRLFRKIVLFGGVALLITASIMLLLMILKPKKTQRLKEVIPTPTPTPKLIDQSLFSRVYSVQLQLKQNDPAQDELFFPNVSESIYLDSPKQE